MNKRFRKLMASLVALLMTFSFITASAVAADKAPVIDRSQITVNQGISDFVTRLYDICLDRTPDPTGFKTWTEQLSNGENTGVGCAYGFIFSNEFQNKNVSNDQYIELMYNCFFGRASDPTGKSNWLNSMNADMTREELFMGFANSTEFFNLCNEYGITAGCHIMGRDFTQTAQINLFVERLYNVILGRPCDQAGMMDWSTRLANREISGAEAAYGFIFSEEYRNKNKSDSDFLEDLYNAFMGRASDPTGKVNWQAALNNGSTDRDIFNGFTGSQEFMGICNSYGIDRGGDITTGESTARAGGNGHWETRLVTPAWDEQVPVYGSECRYITAAGRDITDMFNDFDACEEDCRRRDCGCLHGRPDDDCACDAWHTEYVRTIVGYTTVHHNAVYGEVWVENGSAPKPTNTPAPTATPTPAPETMQYATSDYHITASANDKLAELYVNDVTVYRLSKDEPWLCYDLDALEVEIYAEYDKWYEETFGEPSPGCNGYGITRVGVRDIRTNP